MPFKNSVTFLSVVVNMMFYYDNSLWQVIERCVAPHKIEYVWTLRYAWETITSFSKEVFRCQSLFLPGIAMVTRIIKHILNSSLLRSIPKSKRILLLRLYLGCNLVKKIRTQHLRTFYIFYITTFNPTIFKFIIKYNDLE